MGARHPDENGGAEGFRERSTRMKMAAGRGSGSEAPGEDGTSTGWNFGCDGHLDDLTAKRSSGNEAPG